MKNSKAFYRGLNHAEYKWVGHWDNLHHFQKRTRQDGTGYKCCGVSETDIEDGSYRRMLELNLTRAAA